MENKENIKVFYPVAMRKVLCYNCHTMLDATNQNMAKQRRQKNEKKDGQRLLPLWQFLQEYLRDAARRKRNLR